VPAVNLPRWLVIAGIVIIVLGFLSCGVGVGRDLTEPKPSKNPSTPTPKPTPITSFGPVSFDIVPANAVPAAEVATSPNSCSRDGTKITFAFTVPCTLIVQPSGFLPRELRLFVSTGSVGVAVTQEIRGEPRTSDQRNYSEAGATPAPSGTPHAKIRVSQSAVHVSLTCALGTCVVFVIE
jgi:hypothetical protein